MKELFQVKICIAICFFVCSVDFTIFMPLSSKIGLKKKQQNAALTSTSPITSFSSLITTTPNYRASEFKDELSAHKETVQKVGETNSFKKDMYLDCMCILI